MYHLVAASRSLEPCARTDAWPPSCSWQARGKITAAEVAEELETSVATARRDLEALSVAGVRVYPQAGRGAGRSLQNARTDDHRVRLRVTAPTELMLARGLAGWGQQVDVLEPESVRVELRRIGTELVQRNG